MTPVGLGFLYVFRIATNSCISFRQQEFPFFSNELLTASQTPSIYSVNQSLLSRPINQSPNLLNTHTDLITMSQHNWRLPEYPIPAGVPVKEIVPGSSVVPCERYEICFLIATKVHEETRTKINSKINEKSSNN